MHKLIKKHFYLQEFYPEINILSYSTVFSFTHRCRSILMAALSVTTRRYVHTAIILIILACTLPRRRLAAIRWVHCRTHTRLRSARCSILTSVFPRICRTRRLVTSLQISSSIPVHCPRAAINTPPPAWITIDSGRQRPPRRTALREPVYHPCCCRHIQHWLLPRSRLWHAPL